MQGLYSTLSLDMPTFVFANGTNIIKVLFLSFHNDNSDSDHSDKTESER